MTLLLKDAYLCPGDGHGAHITDSSTCCDCGNQNLASLARILDRKHDREIVGALEALLDVSPFATDGRTAEIHSQAAALVKKAGA